jgi:hypothetical protein
MTSRAAAKVGSLSPPRGAGAMTTLTAPLKKKRTLIRNDGTSVGEPPSKG